MDAVTLSVKGMSVRYGKFAVSDVTFSLKSGDIFGFVGRSGSGKSAVVRNISGLEKQGVQNIEVKIGDKHTDIRRIAGYSPQDNSLYQFLSIEENMQVFGQLQGLRRSEIQARSADLLKRLDLYRHRTKKISDISGGMQKRTDLAVTLISDPSIIILDEPFNGLDISIQKFFWDFLKELAAAGKIIIITSHILSDIQRHCNQIGLVYEGRFYFTGAIIESLLNSKTKSLQEYLEQLFTQGLVKES